MKTLGFYLIALVFVFSFLPLAEAKTRRGAVQNFEKIAQEDDKLLDQFLGLPQETQEAMLKASTHPGILSQLENEQARTSAQFRNLISPYSRKVQEQVYDLTRYPNLLKKLVDDGQLSKGKIKKISKDYPKDIQKAAVEVGHEHYGLLKQIDGLYKTSNQSFDSYLGGLPLSSQTAFRKLLSVPEGLTLLQKNPDFTRAMAVAYEKDPQGTQAQLENWNQQYQRERSDAAEAFQKELKNDPKAAKELKQAAKVYAHENDLEVYETNPPTSVTNVYLGTTSYAPYPYWFGYPFWYPYAYWRPYPYWWYTGFYFGFGWSPFFIGYPSYYYSSWYFGPYGYYYRYPYLSRYYYRNYYRYGYGYRGYRGRYYRGSGFNRAVSRFDQRHHKGLYPNGYVRDGRGANRFREYGHLQKSYDSYRSRNPGTQVTRDTYFRNNARKYPTLRTDQSKARRRADFQSHVTRGSPRAGPHVNPSRGSLNSNRSNRSNRSGRTRVAPANSSRQTFSQPSARPSRGSTPSRTSGTVRANPSGSSGTIYRGSSGRTGRGSYQSGNANAGRSSFGSGSMGRSGTFRSSGSFGGSGSRGGSIRSGGGSSRGGGFGGGGFRGGGGGGSRGGRR